MISVRIGQVMKEANIGKLSTEGCMWVANTDNLIKCLVLAYKMRGRGWVRLG